MTKKKKAKKKARAKKIFFLPMSIVGDSIMDMDAVHSRENVTELAKLGLEHLQSTLGKSNISISDAVNSFMVQKDKASCTHIFVFTIMLMNTHADEFDNVTAPGLMHKWMEQLTKHYENLPESLE